MTSTEKTTNSTSRSTWTARTTRRSKQTVSVPTSTKSSKYQVTMVSTPRSPSPPAGTLCASTQSVLTPPVQPTVKTSYSTSSTDPTAAPPKPIGMCWVVYRNKRQSRLGNKTPGSGPGGARTHDRRIMRYLAPERCSTPIKPWYVAAFIER